MVGYKRQLETAIQGLREMHRRGIKVLPGGDYGFAWTPDGTYARDLEHFVEHLGFTPMEAIISATAWGGEIMLRPDELGKVQPGYVADLILVDGDPLADITVLQDHDKLVYIMKDGRLHKEIADAPAPTPAKPRQPRPQPDRPHITAESDSAADMPPALRSTHRAGRVALDEILLGNDQGVDWNALLAGRRLRSPIERNTLPLTRRSTSWRRPHGDLVRECAA